MEIVQRFFNVFIWLSFISTALITAYYLFQFIRVYKNNTHFPNFILEKNLGKLEGNIKHLKEVIVVANTIEEPQHKLREAVTANFLKGIKYTFVISDNNYDDEFEKYVLIFEPLAKLSLRKKSEAGITNLSNILQIQRLNEKWYTFPYIFYKIQGANNSEIIHAYRGVEIGEGIAKAYELLKPEIAHTIATFFTKYLSEPSAEDNNLIIRNTALELINKGHAN